MVAHPSTFRGFVCYSSKRRFDQAAPMPRYMSDLPAEIREEIEIKAIKLQYLMRQHLGDTVELHVILHGMIDFKVLG